MLYFSKLRILFITLFSVLFILIASSNLFKFDDSFFDKKINLGLDLQGGSYLLLEIDNTPVIEQKLQNLTTTIRNYFKNKNIKINNIKIEEKNIFFNVDDQSKRWYVLFLFETKEPLNQEEINNPCEGIDELLYFDLEKATPENSTQGLMDIREALKNPGRTYV